MKIPQIDGEFMKIRKAKREEMEKILEVINRTEKRTYEEVVPPDSFEDPLLTIQEMKEIFEKMEFYVATKKGEIVGVAALDIVGDDEGRIRWVYVLPEFQRQGIGENLIRRIEKYSKKKGIKKLSVYYVLKEANWAKKFYSSLGYKVSGEARHPHGKCFIYGKEIQ